MAQCDDNYPLLAILAKERSDSESGGCSDSSSDKVSNPLEYQYLFPSSRVTSLYSRSLIASNVVCSVKIR